MNDNLSEIQSQLENKMIEVLAILESHYKKPMPIPTLRLKSNLGLMSGQAFKDNTIELNLDDCKTDWEDMINHTLPHEVCHLVAPLIYNEYRHGYDANKGWGHKRAWKECMAVVNVPARRVKQVSHEEYQSKLKRVVPRNFVYKCPCQKTFNLTPILHNRIQMHGQIRRCNSCRGAITYVGRLINGVIK